MSTQTQNDDGADLQEAAEEEELRQLEEEVENMAQKILEYRTTLPAQLSSTTASLLASQRPVLPTHLVDEGNPEAVVVQGSTRETLALPAPNDSEEAEKVQLLKQKISSSTRETLALPAPNDSEEAEKVQLKQKISSNTSLLPVVLNRMKEYMARIDKLDSSDGIIHPSFKRKRTS